MENTPREMFRWAFREQLRTRLTNSTDSYTENIQRIESGAMDAFDYALRRYGVDKLNLHPIQEND